jgi:hypothetical protein
MTETVSLSRSQTKTVADKLDPLVAALGGIEPAARALGVKTYVVQKIRARKASTSMPREHFDKVVMRLGVSTQGWDTCKDF